MKTWFDFTTTALEPAVLVSHPNGSFEYGGRRISMTCAAFGSPAPDIVWRSPTLGIPSIQPLANANRSISIFTEEITNTHRDALVLSTLELCDHDPSIKDVEISCTTSNGITTDLLGNQSASFFLDPYGKVPIMPPSCCLEGGIGRCLVWKPPNASQSLFERCYYKAGSTVLLNRPPPAVFIAYNTKTWEKSASLYCRWQKWMGAWKWGYSETSSFVCWNIFSPKISYPTVPSPHIQLKFQHFHMNRCPLLHNC